MMAALDSELSVEPCVVRLVEGGQRSCFLAIIEAVISVLAGLTIFLRFR
jgi:hypothetical protein